MGPLVIKVLVVFLAVTTCQGQENCWSNRTDKIAMQKTIRDTNCMRPRDAIIQLPVPDGYDRVIPSAAIAKRCTDLVCIRLDRECVATTNSTRTLRVEAFMTNDGMKKKCFDVEIVDHLTCGCMCEKTQKDCGSNKIFIKKLCRCECPPKAQQDCDARMAEMPNMVMWDPRHCSCPCNNRRPCGNGEVWAYEKCSCVPDVSNEIDTK